MQLAAKSDERRVVISLGLLLIAAIAAILITTTVTTRTATLAQVDDVMERVSQSAGTEAAAFLTPAERLGAITADLIEDGVLPLASPEVLEEYMRDHIKADPILAGMFVGEQDGSFLYVMRSDDRDPNGTRTKEIDISEEGRRVTLTWRDEAGALSGIDVDTTDTYDPRARPWYELATTRDATIWTDAYVFFSSRQPGITTATPIGDAGTYTGVVGVDVEMRELSAQLRRIRVSPGGGILILDGDGLLVAASLAESLTVVEGDTARRLAPTDLKNKVAAAAATAAHTAIGSATDFDFEGREYRTLEQPYADGRWPWSLVIYAPTDDFLTELRQVQSFNNILGIGIGGAALIVGLLLLGLLRRPMARLRRKVAVDELTGLASRHRFYESGPGMLVDGAAVAMFDIDHFKRVNDTYGHQVGDETLVAVARRMQRTLSDDDLLARFGGEEFVAIFPGTTPEQAFAVAERLRRAVSSAPINTTAGPIPVTISIGVALSEPEDDDLSALVGRADQALYVAKRNGRNQVSVTAPTPADTSS